MCVYIQSWLLVCVQNTVAVLVLISIYLEYLMHHATLLNVVLLGYLIWMFYKHHGEGCDLKQVLGVCGLYAGDALLGTVQIVLHCVVVLQNMGFPRKPIKGRVIIVCDRKHQSAKIIILAKHVTRISEICNHEKCL